MSTSPGYPTSAGTTLTLQPGFQDHPSQWYKAPGSMSPEEQRQLLNYLDQIARDFDGPDPVRWEEWGIVPDYLPGGMEEVEDQGRKRCATEVIRWRICLELRWSDPIRLGEGLSHIQWLVDRFEGHPDRTSVKEEDPVLCVYYAVALEMRGGHDAQALDLLSSPGLSAGLGPRNVLLRQACLSRLFRKTGQLQEAVAQEQETYDWVCGHPYSMLPSQFLAALRVAGETNPVLDRLGANHFDGYTELSPTQMMAPHGRLITMMNPTYDGWFPFRPLEANKQDKHECWVSGCRTTNSLSRCASCKVALYCSVQHQKTAWPRHKRLCKGYAEAASDINLT